MSTTAHGLSEVRMASSSTRAPQWTRTMTIRSDARGPRTVRRRSMIPLIWPVGTQDRVTYYEVTVEDAGEKGFIAIGWARDNYPRKCRQPGWDAHTYGYHGDDGRAYNHSGYGRRFNGPFSTGQTVGTGLVLRKTPPDKPQKALIFYTVDGARWHALRAGRETGAPPARDRLALTR